MKTKHLLIVILVASLGLNIVLSAMYLNDKACTLEKEEVVLEEKTPSNNVNEEELSELALLCKEQGSWLEEQQECEWVEETWCDELNGNFNACSSACRHLDAEVAEFCTMECVPVCSFN